MSSILASRWFLVTTAICCAIAVAFTSWLAGDSSGGVRALTALIGLVAALAVMLLVAWALASDEQRPAMESGPDEATLAEPVPWPAAAEPLAPIVPSAREVLTSRLEEGQALGQELEAGKPDNRVGAWIAAVREALDLNKPSALGYFDALAARRYGDDRERLEAHVGRLATVVRDFL